MTHLGSDFVFNYFLGASTLSISYPDYMNHLHYGSYKLHSIGCLEPPTSSTMKLVKGSSYAISPPPPNRRKLPTVIIHQPMRFKDCSLFFGSYVYKSNTFIAKLPIFVLTEKRLDFVFQIVDWHLWYSFGPRHLSIYFCQFNNSRFVAFHILFKYFGENQECWVETLKQSL